MIRILFAILILISTSRAVDTLSIPTDFNSVTTGTRANLSGNFTAVQTWGNKVRDSLAQVTARMSGYTGSLVVSSLSNLRLKLDADNSETARLLVESGTGDSLFTVREDSTARFYGPLSGTSGTFSGTLGAANGTFSGTLGITRLATGSANFLTSGTSPAFRWDQTGAAADERLWDLQAASGQLLFRTRTDANGTGDSWLTVDRTGTTVDGITFLRLVTATAGVSVSDATGLVTTISASTRTLIARSGTTLNFGENGGWTNANFNVASGSHSFGIGGTTRFSIAAGGATTDGGLVVSGTGSAADAKMFVTAADGLALRGKAGSSYDFAIYNPAGNYVLRNPTGTTTVDFPGTGITVAGTEGVTGKITGSDTVAALLGFRAGNTAASNVNLYRTSADMWKTDDSLTVAGKVIADTLVSSKFYEENSYTGTWTGFSSAPAITTVAWVRVGKLVTLKLPGGTGTSNSSAFTLTGMPASIRPLAGNVFVATLGEVVDNGTIAVSTALISTSGTITFDRNGSGSGWTSSGTKGLSGPTSVTYTLQ